MLEISVRKTGTLKEVELSVDGIGTTMTLLLDESETIEMAKTFINATQELLPLDLDIADIM